MCFVVFLFAVYVFSMVALYSCMPSVVKMTSATAVNLSLLTADLFSLFCGIFLFQYKVGFWRATVARRRGSELTSCSRPQFSTLYILSFVVMTVGFVMFNAVPTSSASAPSGDRDAAAGSADGPTESSSDVLLPVDGTAL